MKMVRVVRMSGRLSMVLMTKDCLILLKVLIKTGTVWVDEVS